jgi:phosphoribosylamine--glycine ligase
VDAATSCVSSCAPTRGHVPRVPSGVVLIVCGVGPTMRQARRQAYNRVRNVMIPNMYYREDIGDRWSEEDSDRLHSWGYLRES